MTKSEEIAFIETDYSCAYCGNKGLEHLTIDHIDGRKFKDFNKYDNLIVLCHNCHHRKTNNKGITIEGIKRLKKALIAKTFTQYGLNAIKICSRDSFGITATPFLLSHLVEMGILKQEEIISSYGDEKKEIVSDARFTITDEGKRIYFKWLK